MTLTPGLLIFAVMAVAAWTMVVAYATFLLCKRSEQAHAGVVNLYRNASDTLNSGVIQVLETAATMSQGQAMVLDRISQVVSRDYGDTALALVEKILDGDKTRKKKAGVPVMAPALDDMPPLYYTATTTAAGNPRDTIPPLEL